MFKKSLLVVALFCVVNLINADGASKVVCHYDARSFIREGLGKLTVADVELALAFCTHLVYGFAGINAGDNKILSLNAGLDLDQGKGHYRIITQLKRRFPGLKIMLSVGGGSDVDPDADTNKYLNLLENSGSRIAFINSAYSIIKPTILMALI